MGAVKLIAPMVLAAAFAPASMHALERSRVLWATVDVCNPSDQPNFVGVRGSMPGDGHTGDVMYMRFRIQYQEPSSHRWMNVAKGADSGFVKVGSAGVARQGGQSFRFAPAGGQAYTLRGYVTFQWRHGSGVLGTANKVTQAGHISVVGADPKNYSAATCKLS
ncbi:MAG TPA: hypothetical protein VHS55_05450 [Solirubrobacteraceae bacterium]|jgi:hypothetical protein|nr:hypothetical protein [Solirubrobacteraceae bacterium]